MNVCELRVGCESHKSYACPIFLNLSIERSNQPFSRLTDLELNAEESLRQTELWQDQHAMVATSFTELQALLAPYFEVHIFEHDYEKIVPWDLTSGNALFVCVKI
ncbi:SAM-dependent methyltransferase [Shewanella sp. HN-41]|nr:SAM-dependent methyltransferase [Shewanella sp. HN-41]